MNFPANFCAFASSSNITQEYWSLEEEQITHGLMIAVYLVFCELLGLPWNILVLVIIIKEKLWRQPNIILLVNLIISDLFILLFPTPFLTITGFAGEFIVGSSDKMRCQLCTLMSVSKFIAYANSIITVAMMSLDRFFYIYTPLKYELCSTKYMAGAAVVMSIVISIGFGLFVRFVPGTTLYSKSLMICITMYDPPSLLVPCFVMVIIAGIVIVISISNGCFSRIVLRNIRAVYALNSFDASNKEEQLCKLKKRVTSTRHQKQKRLCCMQLALILASLLPLVSEIILLWTYSQIQLVTVMYIIFYSQVYIHPIIETYLISDIRIRLRDILTCGYFKRKPKDGFNDHKFSNGLKGGKCSFFITALQAAIIPKDNPSSSNNEQLSK